MAYSVSLDQFEGPLDLLLHLITIAKIDIKDIFISDITDQYLAATEDLGGLDMDSASEFLAMAATLIEIKSRSLLPRPRLPEDEEQETPEEELVRRLTEYKAFKDAAAKMGVMQIEPSEEYTKLPDELPPPEIQLDLDSLTRSALFEAFARLMERARLHSDPEPPRRLVHEEFTVQKSVFRIQAALAKQSPLAFEMFFDDAPCKDEMITVFMALLELMRLGRIRAVQRRLFGELLIYAGGVKAAEGE